MLSQQLSYFGPLIARAGPAGSFFRWRAPETKLREKTQPSGTRRASAARRVRLASTTASCPGCSSTAAFSRRRRTSAIRCSSACASCRSRPPTSTSSTWCAWPASTARSRPASRRRSQDGLTPAQQLRRDQSLRRRPRQPTSRPAGATLKAEMAEAGIHIVEPKELRPAERELARAAVHDPSICPILTPIAVDPAHPFPFIQNGGLTVGVELQARARRHHHARAACRSRASSCASSACPARPSAEHGASRSASSASSR